MARGKQGHSVDAVTDVGLLIGREPDRRSSLSVFNGHALADSGKLKGERRGLCRCRRAEGCRNALVSFPIDLSSLTATGGGAFSSLRSRQKADGAYNLEVASSRELSRLVNLKAFLLGHQLAVATGLECATSRVRTERRSHDDPACPEIAPGK